jgi:predicted outer membrane repeat protein
MANTATMYGGGISFERNAFLFQATIADNETETGSGGGMSLLTNADVRVHDSTIAGNSSSADGGGIFATNPSGFLTFLLRQSTVSQNQAQGNGGGIHVGDANIPNVDIMFSTIALNSISAAAGSGAGIYSVPADEPTFSHTIVAQNVAAGKTPSDLVGDVRASRSLIEALIGSATGSNNIFERNPYLGPLADNGGPTQTHALLFGSPAIDSGTPNNLGLPEFDQRGSGFDRIQGQRIDRGAFESSPDVVDQGDFNEDGEFGCADIDELMGAVAAGSNDPIYDLNQDGQLDIRDVAQWLAGAGAANLPSGNPYLFGDANLDGVVDGFDLLIWNQNKFSPLPVVFGWCDGNFNGDAVVDELDFMIWNANKFQSSLVVLRDGPGATGPLADDITPGTAGITTVQLTVHPPAPELGLARYRRPDLVAHPPHRESNAPQILANATVDFLMGEESSIFLPRTG